MAEYEFETVEPVDVSGYKTAAGAAKATAKKIREFAELQGHDPELEVTCQNEDGVWIVYYEAGPYNWAPEMTGGVGFYKGEPQIQGLLDGEGFGVECEYSFALAFYQE